MEIHTFRAEGRLREAPTPCDSAPRSEMARTETREDVRLPHRMKLSFARLGIARHS